MELKRIYAKPEGWEPIRNVRDGFGRLPDSHRAEGVLLNPPPLSHIEVRHTGLDARQHFSTRVVTGAIAEGWMAIRDGQLIVYARPENLTYNILQVPGRYSCFDGAKLPDDEGDTGAAARAVIAERHPGQVSPDPAHPGGYYKINHYVCELDAAQQERFRLRKGKR